MDEVEAESHALPEVAYAIKAMVTRVECPECDGEMTDFIGDPRGGTIDCDHCGIEF